MKIESYSEKKCIRLYNFFFENRSFVIYFMKSISLEIFHDC